MESTKPAEPFLRHVEKDVLIPKRMREKAKERCVEKVEAIRILCFMKNANRSICKKRQSLKRLGFLQKKDNRNFLQVCSHEIHSVGDQWVNLQLGEKIQLADAFLINVVIENGKGLYKAFLFRVRNRLSLQ
ncbi:COX assembly mitochondrial protein homolog isoform X1 [Amia ocellicauda]|uniref:COX assembly mitochondrial protein homolog isoform X1 n=1 Tax=Amia ocellicauda TaxID=2972642 RepID=UPI003464BB31